MGDVQTVDLRHEWAAAAFGQTPETWPAVVREIVSHDFAASRVAHDGFDWPDPTWTVETGLFGGGTYFGWIVDVDEMTGAKISGGFWR